MIFVLLTISGIILGSFINALVWRIREKRDFVRERSECVHCHHQLAWADLIPVVSWVALKGKCRYCNMRISRQYPLIELLTAGLFVVSYIFWPLGFDTIGILLFGLWLIATVLLVSLAVYDAKWMILPDKLVFPLIYIGLLFAVLRIMIIDDLNLFQTLVDIVLGIVSVGGLYFLLYVISKHQWVGFGDVKLGVFIGSILGWKAGLLSVGIANFVGLLIIAPGLLTGKLARTSKVPFGPFLIIGCYVAFLFGIQLINWYINEFILGV